jgi:hypothetical protein
VCHACIEVELSSSPQVALPLQPIQSLLPSHVQDAGVRQAAATALLTLYNVDDNVSPLHAFTARFSTRFAELVYDVDEGVAVKGVRWTK